jgi:hypothetical protein
LEKKSFARQVSTEVPGFSSKVDEFVGEVTMTVGKFESQEEEVCIGMEIGREAGADDSEVEREEVAIGCRKEFCGEDGVEE